MTAKYGLVPPDFGAEARPLALTKRAEFFLEEMLAAGRDGVSSINYPGVRVSDAIHKLRRAGVQVETVHVPHAGEFPGHHGVYRLKSKVVRLASAIDVERGHPFASQGAAHG